VNTFHKNDKNDCYVSLISLILWMAATTDNKDRRKFSYFGA